MKNNFKVKKDTIVFWVVLVPIFIDQLNGVLVHEFSITLSISQVVKAFYLVAFLWVIIVFDKRGDKSVFTLFYITIMLLPLGLVNNHLFSMYSNFYDDLVFSTKLIMLPMAYFAYIFIVENRPFFYVTYLNKLIVILFMTICLAMVLSLAGYGTSNYGFTEDGISYGFRGYFIAGNEVSALYILMYSLFLYYAMYVRNQFFIILMALILGGVTALLMVTKTVLAGYFLISLAMPIMLTFYTKANLIVYPSVYMKKMYLSVIILFSLSITLGGLFFRDRISANLDRMAYNLTKAGDVVGFILSGRDARFGPVLKFYYEKYSIIEMLFGTGWTHFQYANERNGKALTAEMDLIDLLLSNGLIGLAVIYGFWLYMLTKIFNILIKRKSSLSVPLLIATTLLFTNSFFSGHILYSAMLTFYLGFFFALLTVSVSTPKGDQEHLLDNSLYKNT